MDGLRLDAVPYLYERERHQLREPAGDPRLFKRTPAPCGCQTSKTGCSWRRPINGRRMPRLISARVTNATWPSIFPSCPACSWPCAWRTAFPSSTSSSRPRRFPTLPVGPVPAEPRRTHPGDGDRRGAGLHVPGLLPGPPGPHQSGDSPSAGAPAGKSPPAASN